MKKQACIKTNKSRKVSRALNRAKKSLAGVQKPVAEMKARIEAFSESAIEAKIKSLPKSSSLLLAPAFVLRTSNDLTLTLLPFLG